MMTILIPVVAFLGVVAVVGVVGFVLKGRDGRQEERLDAFTGNKRVDGKPGGPAANEIWKEKAFEDDKRNLLDQLMPSMPSLQRVFEQADVNVKASTLLAVSVILLVVGCSAGWLMRI